ncbi:hypothetical protein ACU61A_27650 [Pseudonocardia sichuanensis]
MVDGLSEMGDRAAVELLSKAGPRDERLGFGWTDVAVLVTPVLYIALDQAVRKLVDDSIDGARRGVLRRLRSTVQRRTDGPGLPQLSDAQIAEIRDQVTVLAVERGVPGDKVERVREAVVEVLSGRDGEGSAGTPPTG